MIKIDDALLEVINFFNALLELIGTLYLWHTHSIIVCICRGKAGMNTSDIRVLDFIDINTVFFLIDAV